MLTLRQHALAALMATNADVKADSVREFNAGSASIGAAEVLVEPAGIPGRPTKPFLVPHKELKQRSMASVEGRASLLHALAHIELNAIDLACDLCWRFPGLPDHFYRQWWGVAFEEALHFQLLRDHLQRLGFKYGDFPAHNALWEMAEKTKDDVLARIALVPRTLEARGLDASPAVKSKLVGAGDVRAGEILEVILRDEIGHVKVGNDWFRLLCAQRGLDPLVEYAVLARRYNAPQLRGPFNIEARRAAGFSEQELRALAN